MALSLGAFCALAIIGTTGRATSLVYYLFAAVVLVIVLLDRRSDEDEPMWAAMTDPWMIMFLASLAVVLSQARISGDIEAIAGVRLICSALIFTGSAFIIYDRLRRRANELLFEGMIFTSAIGLATWALVLRTAVPAGKMFIAVEATVAASIAFAALVAMLWLWRLDSDASGSALRIALASVTIMLGVALATAAQAFGVEGIGLAQELLVIAFGTVAAVGLLNPARTTLRSPAISLSPRVNRNRAITTLGSALVGPVLIGVCVGFGLSDSLATVAIGATLLSALVSLHMLRLVKSWGALEHDVHHDSLTGLPNRALFYQRLDLAIERGERDRRTIALMFLDLDRFKNVNDSLGHGAGNDLLRGVAIRLRDAIGSDGTVARLGGDEFAILLPAVKDYRNSEAIARRVLKFFSDPFDIGIRKLYVTPSIGIAHYPTDGLKSDELMENADSAMYRAKERGRNTVELYTAQHRAQAVNRLDLENALHSAIRENQLQVLYQPKVSLRTGDVVGAEALLRWSHPEFGAIPPEEFIPVAEESGLIDVLGEWTLSEACNQAKNWELLGFRGVSVAVNLSPRQFQLQRIQDLVARTLRKTDLTPGSLELELTENLALQDASSVNQTLREIRALGVRMSIDDFGVGYSGIEYLDRFTFDAIKIDRKFVRRIDENGAAPIVTAVIALAKGLDLEVIAEGVETRAQLDFLRAHECDIMQGFLFSRPIQPHQFIEILHRSYNRPTRSAEVGEVSPKPHTTRPPLPHRRRKVTATAGQTADNSRRLDLGVPANGLVVPASAV